MSNSAPAGRLFSGSKGTSPKDFEVTFGEMDLRPGGAWRSGMRAPGGERYVATGMYRDVVAPRSEAFDNLANHLTRHTRRGA